MFFNANIGFIRIKVLKVIPKHKFCFNFALLKSLNNNSIFFKMALSTFVKVSGVNNLSDARYCAGMGVDQIGFNVDPSDKDCITLDRFKEITEWITGVEFVGEIKEGDYTTIKEHLDNYDINYLQLESPDKIKELKLLGFPLILKIDIEKTSSFDAVDEILNKHYNEVEYFIIGSENKNYDKAILNAIFDLSKKYPIVLGYGITENNVNEIIDTSDIKGISLRGGNEIRPGYKDFDDLANILELIEVDDL